MATTSNTRTRKPVAKAKAQAKPAPKQAKLEPQRRPNRSQAEWDELALKTIVPALQAGTTMTEVRAAFGAGPTIRRALNRVGFNTKGQQVEATTVKASTAKVLAQRVASRREAGAAWWRLEQETGKSQDELKALLAKFGKTNLAAGRVPLTKKAKAKVAA